MSIVAPFDHAGLVAWQQSFQMHQAHYIYIAPADVIVDTEMDKPNESFPVVNSINTNDEKQHRAAMQWGNAITGVEQRFLALLSFVKLCISIQLHMGLLTNTRKMTVTV